MINLLTSNYIVAGLRLFVIPILAGLMAYYTVMRSIKPHGLTWAALYWISSVLTNLILALPFLYFANRYAQEDFEWTQFSGVSFSFFSFLVLILVLYLSLYEVPLRVLQHVCRKHAGESTVKESVKYAALYTIILTLLMFPIVYAIMSPNPMLQHADSIINESAQLQSMIESMIKESY